MGFVFFVLGGDRSQMENGGVLSHEDSPSCQPYPRPFSLPHDRACRVSEASGITLTVDQWD